MKKILFIILTFPCLLNAQFKQDTSKNLNYLIIPALFRSPETGWAYGLSGSLSFKTSFKNDPLTRTSNIQGIGLFTQRQQNVQAIDASIFFPKEKFILYLLTSHSYFPDKFWGIGSDTKDNYKCRYSFNQFHFFPHFKIKIAKSFFVGLIYEYQNVYAVTSRDNGSIFDTTAFFGKTPYKVSGAGLSLSYDTRNSSFWPTKGCFFQSIFTSFNKVIGSTFDVNKSVTDIRYFQKILKSGVLALQLYNYSTFGNSPLRELAMIGGSNNMRGFYQGRYRDNCMLTFIMEYRQPVYERISACAFGGTGTVYKTVSDLQKSSLKYSYGLGLRFALLKKERLNLRVDYGYSNKYNHGFYFTAGECF